MGLADLVHWFDQSPPRYWWTVGLCLGGMIGLCVASLFHPSSNPRGRTWMKMLNHDAVFCLAIATVIFAGRWPIIAFPRPINPDEAAFITAAITLWHDPIFWRSICVGTSGPLTSYLLLLPRLFGFPFGYAAARVVGLCASAGIASFLYLAARQFLRRPLARIAIVPTAVFFSLTVFGDFVHYSGEVCPLLLLSAAMFCLAKLWRGQTHSPWLVLITGLLAGAAPFAKLQAAPLAAIIGGTALLILVGQPSNSYRRWRDCLLVICGGILPTLAAVSVTWLLGCSDVLANSYFAANVGYASQGLSLRQGVSSFPEFFGRAELLKSCLVWEVILGIVVLVATATMSVLSRVSDHQFDTQDARPPCKRSRFLVFTLIIGATAFFSVLAPGRHFPHYLLFLIIPGSLWVTACFVCFEGSLQNLKLRTQQLCMACLVIGGAILVLAPQALAVQKTRRPIGHMDQFLNSPMPPPVVALRKFARPGQSLAVWGWMSEMYVDAGMWTATRDAVLGYACRPSDRPGEVIVADYQKVVPPFFKELFMADLRKSEPPVFVDAVCPGCMAFHDRALYGYETFPPLADYIDAHYRLAEEVSGVRIFLRK